MFKNLFGKKKEERGEAHWSVAQGSDSGLPLIYRIRNHPPRGVVPATYPFLVAVSWTYEPANEAGMPSPEDSAQMTRLEELLDPAMEDSQTAYLTVVVTGNGTREWQWYTRNKQEMMQRVNELLSGQGAFPVGFAGDDDPQWDAYRQFQALTGG